MCMNCAKNMLKNIMKKDNAVEKCSLAKSLISERRVI